MSDRFLLTHPVQGVISSHSNRQDAFDAGDRYETKKMSDGRLFCGTPYKVEVHDRMARIGAVEIWRRRTPYLVWNVLPVACWTTVSVKNATVARATR